VIRWHSTTCGSRRANSATLDSCPGALEAPGVAQAHVVVLAVDPVDEPPVRKDHERLPDRDHHEVRAPEPAMKTLEIDEHLPGGEVRGVVDRDQVERYAIRHDVRRMVQVLVEPVVTVVGFESNLDLVVVERQRILEERLNDAHRRSCAAHVGQPRLRGRPSLGRAGRPLTATRAVWQSACRAELAMDGCRSADTSGAVQLAGARLEPPLAIHVLSEMPGCSAMSEAAFSSRSSSP